MNSFLALLKKLPVRQDIALVLMVVATLAMMVLPMPTEVADFLIAVNMGIAVLLLMVALYLKSPSEFSTLPTVILVTTIFRLSIEITTSRLVLVQADAGEIIRTFGEFVISGNVVVGLVVFLIISVVQFLVITKGSERVAEVAARFALDAMPGKQMSIDTDVRNGDIKPEEAKRRRRMLAQESAMHGAMDGAMKFVKGDAIASLVIIAVNLIGGITIGCVQHGMSFSDAVQTYSLLAVGDGLISQIPALLISLTAGLIVTRVDDDHTKNLGTEVLHQIATDPRTMYIASVMLFAMGLIPGFPWMVFFFLSFALGAGAYFTDKRRAAEKVVAEVAMDEAMEDASAGSPIVVQLGPSLAGLRAELWPVLRDARKSVVDDLGIALPRMEVRETPRLNVGMRVELDRIEILAAQLAADEVWAEAVPEAMLGVAEPRLGPGNTEWLVLPADAAEQAREGGAVVHDVRQAAALFLREQLLKIAGQFVGIQETQAMVTRTEKIYGDLVRETVKAAPLPRLAEVFRRLVEERVSLHNVRGVMEAVAEWAPREKNTSALAEYVRVGIRQQICHQLAQPGMRLSVILMEDELSEQLFGNLFETFTGAQLQLENPENLVDRIRQQAAGAGRPSVVTTMELRRPLWELLSRYGVDLPVLSHPEVAPGFRVEVVGTVGVEHLQAPQANGPTLRAIEGGASQRSAA